MKALRQKGPRWCPGSGQVLALSLALATLFPVPVAAAVGLTLLIWKWIVALANAEPSAASRSHLSQKGQSLTEYALVILLVSVLMVAALSALATGMGTVFDKAASALQEAIVSVEPAPDGPSCSS